MFYVLLASDGSVDRYPYTLIDLRLANPGTSFATQISAETAAAFSCYPVTPTTPPADDHTVNLDRTAVKQGDTWVEEWVSTPASPEQIAERTAAKANDVRADRNRRLAECDWTQIADSPLHPEGKAAWAFYRENLRMVPEQPGFPWEIQWPPLPSA